MQILSIKYVSILVIHFIFLIEKIYTVQFTLIRNTLTHSLFIKWHIKSTLPSTILYIYIYKDYIVHVVYKI